MDGTQFLLLSWFLAKNNPPQTSWGGVHSVVNLMIIFIFYFLNLNTYYIKFLNIKIINRRKSFFDARYKIGNTTLNKNPKKNFLNTKV